MFTPNTNSAIWALTLQTAFHASFSDNSKADKESLKISRGTSVVSSRLLNSSDPVKYRLH